MACVRAWCTRVCAGLHMYECAVFVFVWWVCCVRSGCVRGVWVWCGCMWRVWVWCKLTDLFRWRVCNYFTFGLFHFGTEMWQYNFLQQDKTRRNETTFAHIPSATRTGVLFRTGVTPVARHNGFTVVVVCGASSLLHSVRRKRTCSSMSSRHLRVYPA